MSQNLIYLGYSLAWKIVRLLPEKFAYKLADRFADLLYGKNGKGVSRLRSNYQRIRPELNSDQLEFLTNAGMRSYLRYWCDTFRFPGWDNERLVATTVCDNENFLRDAILEKRGCIVALPHAGNWDHAGAYFCAQDIPLTTVVEHLKPERLFKKFLEHREEMGMEALDLNARVSATLAQRLRSGKLVALVADRDLSRSGITVNFFDGVARMPGGPAALAIQTGAPLITAYVAYQPIGISITFEAPIAVPISGTKEEQILAMTQKCADRFAANISKFPEDWHMLQRIWVDGDFMERSE